MSKHWIQVCWVYLAASHSMRVRVPATMLTSRAAAIEVINFTNIRAQKYKQTPVFWSVKPSVVVAPATILSIPSDPRIPPVSRLRYPRNFFRVESSHQSISVTQICNFTLIYADALVRLQRLNFRWFTILSASPQLHSRLSPFTKRQQPLPVLLTHKQPIPHEVE